MFNETPLIVDQGLLMIGVVVLVLATVGAVLPTLRGNDCDYLLSQELLQRLNTNPKTSDVGSALVMAVAERDLLCMVALAQTYSPTLSVLSAELEAAFFAGVELDCATCIDTLVACFSVTEYNTSQVSVIAAPALLRAAERNKTRAFRALSEVILPNEDQVFIDAAAAAYGTGSVFMGTAALRRISPMQRSTALVEILSNPSIGQVAVNEVIYQIIALAGDGAVRMIAAALVLAILLQSTVASDTLFGILDQRNLTAGVYASVPSQTQALIISRYAEHLDRRAVISDPLQVIYQ